MVRTEGQRWSIHPLLFLFRQKQLFERTLNSVVHNFGSLLHHLTTINEIKLTDPFELNIILPFRTRIWCQWSYGNQYKCRFNLQCITRVLYRTMCPGFFFWRNFTFYLWFRFFSRILTSSSLLNINHVMHIFWPFDCRGLIPYQTQLGPGGLWIRWLIYKLSECMMNKNYHFFLNNLAWSQWVLPIELFIMLYGKLLSCLAMDAWFKRTKWLNYCWCFWKDKS